MTKGPPNPKPKPKPRPKHLKADAITKLCEAAEANARNIDMVVIGILDREPLAAQFLTEYANALREAVKGVRGES